MWDKPTRKSSDLHLQSYLEFFELLGWLCHLVYSLGLRSRLFASGGDKHEEAALSGNKINQFIYNKNEYLLLP